MKTHEMPWPEQGQKLFRATRGIGKNACLGWMPAEMQTSLYSTGYKDAADILVTHALESRGSLDTLVYPAVFLYRHCLELQIKSLIDRASLLVESATAAPSTHRLDTLWGSCRPLLEKIWPHGDREELDVVEECIKEFSNRDPRSIAFRYPIDLKGAASHDGMARIDMQNFREVADGLASFFGACESAIMEYWQDMPEMCSDY